MSKLCLQRKLYLCEIITFDMFCCNPTKLLNADKQATYYPCVQRYEEFKVYFDLLPMVSRVYFETKIEKMNHLRTFFYNTYMLSADKQATNQPSL